MLPNVVVIVLDTARPDHMSLYGYPHPTTPVLNELSREGVVFDRAYSTSSWTLPSHASLFTGLYPSEHGATGEHFWLDDRFATLAEQMRALGYRTWAASGNAMVGSISNLDRGFERFFESWRGSTWTMLSLPRALARLADIEPDEGARDATRRVTWWIQRDGAESPYFLFVNLIEAHAPYEPPEPYRSRLLEGRRAPSVDIYGNRFLDYMLGLTSVGDEELDSIRRLYDGELAYVDHRVGEIVAALRASGSWDRTLLVITADHGESLGEHRLMDHQLCVYETLTRIPLLVVGPGFARGTRVPGIVQLHDVFATVLAAVGQRKPPASERAPRDLAAIASGREPARDIAVSEYHRPVAVLKMLEKKLALAGRTDGPQALARFDRTLRALVLDHWKWIAGSNGENELFDLATDPGEEHNLAGKGLAEESTLAARLTEWTAPLAMAGGEGGEGALRADDQAKERLRALGYIE
ncbi:MAG: sulfatase [bacterium]